MEIGILGDVKFVDLNNDWQNEIVLKTFSGNSADDRCLIYQDKEPYLRLIDVSMDESDVVADHRGRKFVVTYSPIDCKALAWRSKLLRYDGDSILVDGEMEYTGCNDSKTVKVTLHNVATFDVHVPKEENASQPTMTSIKAYWKDILDTSKSK